MTLRNIEGLTMQDLAREISMGAKFVTFPYTISIVFMTFRRSSDIYLLRSEDSHWSKSLPFTLLSFVLGWWGIPWGLIYTPAAIYTNLTGGKDVTNEVLTALSQQIKGQSNTAAVPAQD